MEKRKNIHLLPTDKPSRLYLGNNGNFVFGMMQTSIQSKNDDFTNQNIYITNLEEIKVNDYITDGYLVWQWKDDSSLLGRKKIILTTDQDLINDGVQAIDDGFLEWFVKNPSCEGVEIGEGVRYEDEWIDNEDGGEIFQHQYCSYKIIIPKEEPKQDLEKEMFELEEQLDIPSHLRWHNSKPKQETLEEAIGKRAVEYCKQYEGTDKYNVAMLAIEFGYQLKLEEDEK